MLTERGWFIFSSLFMFAGSIWFGGLLAGTLGMIIGGLIGAWCAYENLKQWMKGDKR